MKKFIITFFALVISIFNYSQDLESKYFNDCYKDTVLVINDKYLCNSKILLYREDILEIDSIYCNKDKYEIYSYSVSSFALGNTLKLNVHTAKIPLELKQALASKEIIYKFIYIRNILLVDNKNNIVNPTYQEIKITFIN